MPTWRTLPALGASTPLAYPAAPQEDLWPCLESLPPPRIRRPPSSAGSDPSHVTSEVGHSGGLKRRRVIYSTGQKYIVAQIFRRQKSVLLLHPTGDQIGESRERGKSSNPSHEAHSSERFGLPWKRTRLLAFADKVHGSHGLASFDGSAHLFA